MISSFAYLEFSSGIYFTVTLFLPAIFWTGNSMTVVDPSIVFSLVPILIVPVASEGNFTVTLVVFPQIVSSALAVNSNPYIGRTMNSSGIVAIL